MVRRVRIQSQTEQPSDDLQILLRGSLVGDPFHPADARRNRECRVAIVGRDGGIGPVLQQELHQLHIARLRGSDERRRAGFEEPLHREDCPTQGIVADADVRVRSALQQDLDELQVVHVRPRYRIVAALDIAVVGREIERGPAALVGQVDIGAQSDQLNGQLVVSVVGRRQQRRPAVLGWLVDRSAPLDQEARRLGIAFPRRKHQRRQPAAARAHQSSDNDVVVRVHLIHEGLGTRRRSWTGGRVDTTSSRLDAN